MICKKCGIEKSEGDFYGHPKSKNGLDSSCKECRKKAVKVNRLSKAEYYREYDKARAKDPKRVKARKAYSKTEAGRKAGSKAKRKYIEKNTIKRAVHVITGNAIRDGRLIKRPCEVCRSVNVHAHHDDYSEPLNVRWLCAAHHRQWHNENGEGLNAN